MLVGLALIALPLLFAIVNAALQIRALADRGQKLVEDGVAAARASQDLFAQIASMERTAQLYDILRDPNLMDAYQRGNQQLSATRSVLYRQQVPQARASLDQMGEQQALILRQLKAGSSSPSNDPTLLNRAG
jgi:two-component system, NtrC family, sensor histidine kinase GlrK